MKEFAGQCGKSKKVLEFDTEAELKIEIEKCG